MSLLDLTNDPALRARQLGLLAPNAGMSAPQMPAAAPPPAVPQMPRELYGLLAQYANDPTDVGLDYASKLMAIRKQQAQAQQSANPMEQFLKMYGSINPRDFTPESLQKFQDTFVQTGQPRFDLLQRIDDLSNKEQGFLNEAITRAQKAEYDVGRMATLANRFEEMKPQLMSGAAGSASEWLARLMGSEDEVTRLRTEYEQLRVSGAVNSLPKGPASDKDIQLVLKGWPSSTASPEYLASFLRGMQKLRVIEMAQASHSAAYLSRNKSQAGQLSDWNKNKDWLVEQAAARAGIQWSPTGRGQPTSTAAPATTPTSSSAPAAPTSTAAPATRKNLGLGTPPAASDVDSLVNKWLK